ncbi:MAG: AraC family transcriptional regulator [Firmicutes bacterium]|nr:AraC family transcriptional regulator [Bacillota bacterium]
MGEKIKFNEIMKIRRKSIIFKLIISYLTVLLFLSALNFSSYLYIKNVLIEKESSINSNYLKYLSQLMDTEISSLQKSAYNFLNNRKAMDGFSDLTSIKTQHNIMLGLQTLSLSTNICDVAFLYIAENDKVISNIGLFDKDSFFVESDGWSKEENLKLNQTIESSSQFDVLSVVSFAPNAVSEHSILVIAGYEMDYGQKIIMCINRDKIKEFIGSVNFVNHNNVYMIDKASNIIYDFERSDTDSIDHSFFKKLEGSSKDTVQLGNSLAVIEKSNFFDGCYVSVIPKKRVLTSISNISLFLIFNFAIFVLIGILLLPFLIKVSYMPLYNILVYYKNIFNDNEIIDNEYNYMINVLDKLKLENVTYNEMLNLFEFIKNGKYNANMNTFFDGSMFCLGIVRYNREDLFDAAVWYIGNNKPLNCNVRSVRLCSNEFVVILNGDMINDELTEEYFSAMKKYIEDCCGKTALISVSDVKKSVESLHSLYKRAQLAKDSSSCYEIDKIIRYTNNVSRKTIYFPDDFESIIRMKIGQEQKDDIGKIILNVFEKNGNKLTFYELGFLVSEFLNIYFGLMGNNVLKPSRVDVESFFAREYEIQEIINYIIRLFKGVSVEESANYDAETRIRENIIQYINENYYSHSLSVDSVAAHFKISTPYFSTTFKKITGINFSDYILNKRIREAKTLLTTTDLSVKAISEKVGIGTYNSFVRSFGKNVGVSPGKYRKLKGNE